MSSVLLRLEKVRAGETKTAQAENKATRAETVAVQAEAVATQATLRTPQAPSSAAAFNPEISLVLSGSYTNQAEIPNRDACKVSFLQMANSCQKVRL